MRGTRRWAAADADHSARRGEHREKILAKFDTNHDGKLEQDERAAAKAACQQHRAERQAKLKAKHPELFAKIDKDGDGKIDNGEGKAWRKEHHGERRRHHDGDQQN